MNTLLERFNPIDKTDDTVTVCYLNSAGNPIPGTERIIQVDLKDKPAMPRPEGLPAVVSLSGHEQEIKIKLKPGQTMELLDSHNHSVGVGMPTATPDEYLIKFPYAHPHRHNYSKAKEDYTLRIVDGGTNHNFGVQLSHEIPPVKGTLSHGALGKLKKEIKNKADNGTMSIEDYRDPHTGDPAPGDCITWHTSGILGFKKYKATITGLHGTIEVEAAKTPEELIKNIQHELDHVYEHEMLEYCKVFNKPVPDNLKHHDHAAHPAGDHPATPAAADHPA